jgi:[ribosomal protein S5]-alanine N-acetyltransferase
VSFPVVPLQVPGQTGWSLRPWHADDAPALAAVAGDPAVWRWMSDHFPNPYTLEVAQHWVTVGHREFGGGHNAAIDHEGVAVGGAGWHPGIGPARCNVEIGYYLAPAFWRRGVGTAVVGALVKLALQQPEVTRVFAPIHAGNAASAGVLRRNGFQLEGVQRLSAFKAGRVIDIESWALYCEPAEPGGA